MLNDFIQYTSRFIDKEEIIFSFISLISVALALILDKYIESKVNKRMKGE